MNKNTENKRSIDELISEALKEDQKDFVKNYKQDPGVFELIFLTFRGKNGWLGWATFVLQFASLFLALFFGYKAFQADSPQETTLWASGTILCYVGIVALKLGNWIDAGRRSTLQEIKRLELQIAKLSETKN
ncbi:MAG: DUF6768 family protein [Verrucomicrobiota bacterium]